MIGWMSFSPRLSLGSRRSRALDWLRVSIEHRQTVRITGSSLLRLLSSSWHLLLRLPHVSIIWRGRPAPSLRLRHRARAIRLWLGTICSTLAHQLVYGDQRGPVDEAICDDSELPHPALDIEYVWRC